MTPHDLIAAFEALTEAPGGIARIRELILQLAVRGRLVPQDSMEDPASVLLDAIRAEKVQMKGGARRGPDPQHVSDAPFEVPPGWEWVPLGRYCHLEMGQSPPSTHYNRSGEGLPFFQGKADFGATHPTPRYWCTKPTKLAQAGDVLLSVRAPVGPTNIADRTCCIGRGLAALRPLATAPTRHLMWTIRAFAQDLQAMATGTTFAAISRRDLDPFLIPVAPLAEQHRIVARVDELMALLDRLEAARTTREATRAGVRDSALAALRGADAPEEVEAAWNRFAERMDDLVIEPTDIAALRQTVLELAVRGRLVAQDPNDEPVSLFLDRIVAKKTQLASSRRTRSTEAYPPVSTREKSYEVPRGWRWVRFGDTHINRDGERVPLSREVRERRHGPYDYYGASGVIDHIDDFLFDGPLLLIGEDGANLLLRSTPIAFMAHGKYWVNNHAHVLDSVNLQSLMYLGIFINAIDLKPYVTGTAQPKLNQARLNSIPCALPPLPEQIRIVARVGELMALIDRLEGLFISCRARHASFAAAAVHHLDA